MTVRISDRFYFIQACCLDMHESSFICVCVTCQRKRYRSYSLKYSICHSGKHRPLSEQKINRAERFLLHSLQFEKTSKNILKSSETKSVSNEKFSCIHKQKFQTLCMLYITFSDKYYPARFNQMNLNSKLFARFISFFQMSIIQPYLIR